MVSSPTYPEKKIVFETSTVPDGSSMIETTGDASGKSGVLPEV
jgi:hypothetical protein